MAWISSRGRDEPVLQAALGEARVVCTGCDTTLTSYTWTGERTMVVDAVGTTAVNAHRDRNDGVVEFECPGCGAFLAPTDELAALLPD